MRTQKFTTIRLSFGVLLCLFAFFYNLAHIPVEAQTLPTESTSKIKRVLLYNKIGGWTCNDCRDSVQKVFLSLADAKGFEVDVLSSDENITLEFLKNYQALVWNNSSNAAASMPSETARQAVADFVDQGGGWMLVGLALHQSRTWPYLDTLMGTDFARRGSVSLGVLRSDSSAKRHPELRYFLNALPDTVELQTHWSTFLPSIREAPGITVLFSAHGQAIPKEINGDSNHTYIWAREKGKGKVLFNALGWPAEMSQADSVAAQIYWQSLRWLAGDFQLGCTHPTSTEFNPAARIDNGSCEPASLRSGAIASPIGLVWSQGRLRIETQHYSALHFRARDLQGRILWDVLLPAGSREIMLPAQMEPGLHWVEICGKDFKTERYRLVMH